jgi:hypothetical protein
MFSMHNHEERCLSSVGTDRDRTAIIVLVWIVVYELIGTRRHSSISTLFSLNDSICIENNYPSVRCVVLLHWWKTCCRSLCAIRQSVHRGSCFGRWHDYDRRIFFVNVSFDTITKVDAIQNSTVQHTLPSTSAFCLHYWLLKWVSVKIISQHEKLFSSTTWIAIIAEWVHQTRQWRVGFCSNRVSCYTSIMSQAYPAADSPYLIPVCLVAWAIARCFSNRSYRRKQLTAYFEFSDRRQLVTECHVLLIYTQVLPLHFLWSTSNLWSISCLCQCYIIKHCYFNCSHISCFQSWRSWTVASFPMSTMNLSLVLYIIQFCSYWCKSSTGVLLSLPLVTCMFFHVKSDRSHVSSNIF